MITPIININFKNVSKVHFRSTDKIERAELRDISDTFESREVQTSGADEFGKNLLKLNGISCPVCGTKMMNKETYHTILNLAKMVETPQQYIELIKQYQQYLPQYSREVVAIAEGIVNKNPEVKLNAFLEKIQNMGEQSKMLRIKESIQYLEDKQELGMFTLRDSKLVQKCIGLLKAQLQKSPKDFEYVESKDILNSTLGQLESSEKTKIYNHVRNAIKSGFLAQNSFRVPDCRHSSKERNVFHAMRNLFEQSKGYYTKISDCEKFENYEGNNVLICGDCHSYREKRSTFFPKQVDYSKLQRNFNIYLEDLTQAIGLEQVPQDPDIIWQVANITKWASASKIEISKIDLKGKVDHAKFIKERPDFLPATVDEDIPCASCGTLMVNHFKKRMIMTEIRRSKNAKELTDILIKYEKYINPELKEFVNLAKELTMENPDISGEELMMEIQILSSINVKNALKKVVSETRKKSDSDIGTEQERQKLKEFADALEKRYLKMPVTKYFNYDEYRKFLTETSIYKNCDIFRLKNLVMHEFRHTVAVNNLAYPIPVGIEKNNGDEYKTFVEGVFKSSGFTVDHFIAKKHNGDDRLSNLIGMCKLCNTSKSSATPREWAKQNPDASQNMILYLKTIENLAKDGKLPGFEKYPFDVAYTLNKVTEGLIEIRMHFNKIKTGKSSLSSKK